MFCEVWGNRYKLYASTSGMGEKTEWIEFIMTVLKGKSFKETLYF